MTYEMAFIMVGRVLFWIALVMAPAGFFRMAGRCEAQQKHQDGALCTVLAWAFYAAVILCARYVQ